MINSIFLLAVSDRFPRFSIVRMLYICHSSSPNGSIDLILHQCDGTADATKGSFAPHDSHHDVILAAGQDERQVWRTR